MKILTTDIHNNTSFYSAHRVYSHKLVSDFKSFESKYIHTTTNLFREDLDWQLLIGYIKKHFADKTKVNAYSLACSDGSEAYSYAIAILENCAENISKYLPITACDIDPEMINAAKSGRINIYGGEFKAIEKLGFNLRNYFINPELPKQYTDDELYLYINSASYEATPELRDSIIFKQSDILTELKNIKDDGNSVVMCRNVLPYLSEDYVNEIVKTASENLKQGSLFITGNYDHRSNIEEKLLNNGFYKPFIDNHNIFVRGNIVELTDRLLMGYLV